MENTKKYTPAEREWILTEQGMTKEEAAKYISVDDSEFDKLCAFIESSVAMGKDWKAQLFPTKPDSKKKKEKKSNKCGRLSIEALREELHYEGIMVKFNDLSHAIDTIGYRDNNPEHSSSTLATALQDQLADIYTGVNFDTISHYLYYIATENHYNPMLDFLHGIEWDGKDRLSELYNILGLSDDDTLSKTLLVKWIWQGIALLHNDPKHPYGADGVLTLEGDQGLGKTSVIRHLAMKPEFFREGQRITNFDKDDKRRCITTGVCELGELDSTFKRADVGALKAFITQPFDEYRLPYGREDVQAPRRTNLAATVNDTNFLIDPTGNRRFWTIHLNTIDVDKLDKFDAGQLWKQVWKQNIKTPADMQGFRLTAEERQQLEERNSSHIIVYKAEDEVADVLAEYDRCFEDRNGKAHGGGYWVKGYITITDWQEKHSVLKKFSASQIGKVLDKLDIKMKIKKQDGKAKRLRLLPYIDYSSK